MNAQAAALYMMSSEVRAKHFAEGKTISIGAPNSEVRDQIYVPAGHWAIRDSEGSYELGDDDFRARFISVPPDRASFAMRGRPVSPRIVDGMISIGDDRAPLSSAEFAADAIRLASDLRPICRVNAPLAVQAEMLKAAGAEAHLADLRDRANALRSQIIADPAVAADLTMMDVVLSGLKDSVSDGMAGIHHARPPEGLRDAGVHDGQAVYELDPDSVRGQICLNTGVHPGLIVDLIHSPAYESSQFRALARVSLTPYLGTRAMEDVLALSIPVGDQGLKAQESVEGWLSGGSLIAEGPEIEIPEIPDYRTSRVRHFRFDGGIDAVAFDDVFGAYVYAWRTPPQPVPQP